MEINGEDDLKSAVTTMGPIAVTVDATSNGFRVSILYAPFLHADQCVHLILS